MWAGEGSGWGVTLRANGSPSLCGNAMGRRGATEQQVCAAGLTGGSSTYWGDGRMASNQQSLDILSALGRADGTWGHGESGAPNFWSSVGQLSKGLPNADYG